MSKLIPIVVSTCVFVSCHQRHSDTGKLRNSPKIWSTQFTEHEFDFYRDHEAIVAPEREKISQTSKMSQFFYAIASSPHAPQFQFEARSCEGELNDRGAGNIIVGRLFCGGFVLS